MRHVRIGKERVVAVLTWLVSGVMAGWVVRVAMRSRRDFGIVGDLVLGSLGGVTGGWLFKHLGVTTPVDRLVHVFVGVAGATMLVGGLRVLRHLLYATGVTVLPAALALEADLDTQVRLLGDFERRVLARVLRRKPSTEDPNRIFDAQLTFGQRIADRVALFGGSWTFIGLFFTGLMVWMLVNGELKKPFDPYPFILLNLVLSCLAAIQAPVIMMSQNRQAAKDRLDARNDYEVNLRAEMEIMRLHAKLDDAREREWSEYLKLQRDQLEALRRIEIALLQTGGGAPGSSPA
jgi:uncharacterized membrane protein/uncharacterized membrane protein YeaQ/YmgE (transglycosylase-associated protein family)